MEQIAWIKNTIPQSEQDSTLLRLSESLKREGFSAVIVPFSESEYCKSPIIRWLDAVRSAGLTPILRMASARPLSPADPHFSETVRDSIAPLLPYLRKGDAFFYSSSWLEPSFTASPFAEYCTLAELIESELFQLQELFQPFSLYFHFPLPLNKSIDAGVQSIVKTLIYNARTSTHLLFEAPFSIHQPICSDRLWAQFYEMDLSSSSSIMPVWDMPDVVDFPIESLSSTVVGDFFDATKRLPISGLVIRWTHSEEPRPWRALFLAQLQQVSSQGEISLTFITNWLQERFPQCDPREIVAKAQLWESLSYLSDQGYFHPALKPHTQKILDALQNTFKV